MSTNTTILNGGAVRSARHAFEALLAAILLAGAVLLAVNAGSPPSGSAAAPASDAVVQQALIDHRAGERASRTVTVPTAEFWADFRAAEREMR